MEHVYIFIKEDVFKPKILGSISMSCNELSKEESSEFLSALSSDGFKDLQSLTISSTSFIQLDHLPTLSSLKYALHSNFFYLKCIF